MHRAIVPIAFAAMLGGCGKAEETDPGVAAASPPPEAIVATPNEKATAPDRPGAYEPTAEDALNAGLTMMAARDVCRLPAEQLAKFAAYSEWIVNRDPRRKAIFIAAANEARRLHQAIIRQGRQEAYRRETCPQVRRILSSIEQGIRSYPMAKAGADAR